MHRSIQHSLCICTFTSNSVSVFQCLFNFNCMMRWQDASCNWMHLQFTLHLQYVLCVAPCVFYYPRQLSAYGSLGFPRQLSTKTGRSRFSTAPSIGGDRLRAVAWDSRTRIRIRQLMTFYDAILTNGVAMVQLSRVKPRGEHPSGHTAQRDTRTSIQGRIS